VNKQCKDISYSRTQ